MIPGVTIPQTRAFSGGRPARGVAGQTATFRVFERDDELRPAGRAVCALLSLLLVVIRAERGSLRSGSTFRIRLVLRHVAGVHAGAEPVGVPRPGARRLLVVDGLTTAP